MLKYILCFLGSLFISLISLAQDLEPSNGVKESKNTLYAITNATVFVSADEVINNATILFRNGKIEKVGKLIVIPKEAVKIDREGYTVYPSFIDPYSDLGMPKAVSLKKGFMPQLSSLIAGPYYWNETIQPERQGFVLYDSKLAKAKSEWVKAGYGTISTHQSDGLMRGTAMVTTLGNQPVKEEIVKTVAANHYSFKKGVSKQTYPSSQMGAIALMRQYFYDYQWYMQLPKTDQTNAAFDATKAQKDLPHIFEVTDKLEIYRVLKIGEEFDLPFILFGDGDTYQRINELKDKLSQIILPLNYPDAYDLTDPFIARYIKLSDLKHWELAPYNPYILKKNGVEISFSLYKTKKKATFQSQLSKTIKHGLSKEEALKALTVNPAKILGIDGLVGTLETGKLANFIVVKGDVFNGGVIHENWIRGQKESLKPINSLNIDGKYSINIDGKAYQALFKGSDQKLSGEITSITQKTDSISKVVKNDTIKSPMISSISGNQISCVFYLFEKEDSVLVQLNGVVHPKIGIIEGNALLNNGEWVKWSAIKNKSEDKKNNTKEIIVDTSALHKLTYPAMAFGFDSLPEAKMYFIKNATLWTNEKQGIVKNANLLIKDGKIQAINKKINSFPNNTIIIDAKGKHVTSGIIDEHSHIAISKGVNEGGQAISAEVSIADVVRSNDINIYRQLAGGVTCSQLLHGSANPIGGQSALIKLKWGESPQHMLVANAAPFIKFALGENVKQSNWGDFNRVRFPQTRMGVEQVFYDAFLRAKAYKQEWDEYNSKSGKKSKNLNITPPRRDLELETILQIVESKRFVTCHSYIQSEINMLMKVADSVGFTLNTFTHILEGYKVADKMKAHGAGASTFSDWWAYKFEVNEAIPYNAAILHKMGVITAINSDDAEMGRRLNHEAAKIVKYGGVSEEDAWKMVTLNPAILLHVDDRMGSLKEGKDADIVIWSDNPLSITAKVEKTFIDGKLYYASERNQHLYERDQQERKRILGLMLADKLAGKPTQKPVIKTERHYHCDTMGE
ncbi:MAG: amidohydrolase family protein [Putridiphycobacter sp.]|nr:amidohydrolase family protein [Putridiphycobacter sp.]